MRWLPPFLLSATRAPSRTWYQLPVLFQPLSEMGLGMVAPLHVNACPSPRCTRLNTMDGTPLPPEMEAFGATLSTDMDCGNPKVSFLWHIIPERWTPPATSTLQFAFGQPRATKTPKPSLPSEVAKVDRCSQHNSEQYKPGVPLPPPEVCDGATLHNSMHGVEHQAR